jgi:hypothetical protein
MFGPAKPSIAGINVTAMAIATSTVPAAASPMTVRKGMPTTDRPARAMTTVMPANTTAPPAVALARAADSSTLCPSARFWRCRVTMNRA